MTSAFIASPRSSRPPIFGAGAKARQHVAPVGRVEVPPGVAQEPSTCRPAAAAQHLVGSREPGLRILLVRVSDEPGIGLEGARGPLPDVADHLPASVLGVAGGMAPDLDGAACEAVEVGALRVRRSISPGEPALARAAGRELPLRLGGKAPPRPAAVRLRFEP